MLRGTLLPDLGEEEEATAGLSSLYEYKEGACG